MTPLPTCSLCQTVQDSQAGVTPFLVQAFTHSILVVGQHQLYPGYCVLISREHAREPFDLPAAEASAVMSDVLRCARAINAAYVPLKMNYSCYGNQVPHVHWHLIPRYNSDPQKLQPPWTRAAEFEANATTATQALDVIRRVREELSR